MRDIEFVDRLLRVEDPWRVVESRLDLKRQRVDVRLEWEGPGRCPECGRECAIHDHRERTWRDLDLCADQLYVHALVPRVDCPEHGVKTVVVPWATGRTELTEGFVRPLGIDEKAVKKRHRYFTIVSDVDRGEVLWIARGRKREALDAFWATLSREQLDGIEGIAMDRWEPYIGSTLGHVPDAAQKIVFDRFHITSYLTKAVDLTRRALMRDPSINREGLKGSKTSRITNAGAEGMNSKIQMIKYRARGYRNEGRFERAIIFHCSGLDLLPTHSNS